MTADKRKHFPPAQANGVPLLQRRVVKAEIDNANRFLTFGFLNSGFRVYLFYLFNRTNLLFFRTIDLEEYMKQAFPLPAETEIPWVGTKQELNHSEGTVHPMPKESPSVPGARLACKS